MHGQKRSQLRSVGALLTILAIGLVAYLGFGRHYLMSQAFAAEDLRRYEELWEYGELPELSEGELPYRTGKVILVVPEVWMIYREGPAFTTQISPAREGRKIERVAHRRIDSDWFRLPASVRASHPDEVETVILCEFATQLVGYYVPEGETPSPRHMQAGKKARRRVAHLWVYDLESQRLIGEHEVIGPPVKAQIREFESQMGERPDLASFVESMPTR